MYLKELAQRNWVDVYPHCRALRITPQVLQDKYIQKVTMLNFQECILSCITIYAIHHILQLVSTRGND